MAGHHLGHHQEAAHSLYGWPPLGAKPLWPCIFPYSEDRARIAFWVPGISAAFILF